LRSSGIVVTGCRIGTSWYGGRGVSIGYSIGEAYIIIGDFVSFVVGISTDYSIVVQTGEDSCVAFYAIVV
jgi:hypothetical protein